MNRTSTPDIQISISIIQRIPIQGIVTDPPVVDAMPIVMGAISGKISAKVSAQEVRKTVLDALRQSYGEDFEETEGLDLSVS